MRSLFITHRLMAATDIGLISFFLGLTFHRMANQLFDDQGNCLWDYNNMKADIFDTISRIIMFNASLYLADYFTHKVFYIFYDIYIYIYYYYYYYYRN